MAIEHDSDPLPELQPTWLYRTGAVSGVVATGLVGLAITAVDVETLRVAIAGLYGFEGSLVAGWVAHLVHGTLFGVVFAAVLADPGLYRLSEHRWKTVLAGVAYGLLLAVFGVGFVMPLWMDVLGTTDVSALPYVTGATLTWHVAYGAVLGGLVATLDGR